jgi:hypothetical protein
MNMSDQITQSPACLPILQFVRPEHYGVEIGVFKGTSSRLFLNRCSFMYFIDPCIDYPESSNHDIFVTAKEFLKLMEAYEPRFSFIKAFSVDAAYLVPFVDFVFVDGEHKYEFVKQDVELYWPKVRAGGFMCGHDYSPDNTAGVNRAVNEFFAALHLPVENHSGCWFVSKP